MTFGETLTILLETAGITRGHLAACLGYDISYISRWVSGLKLPSVKNNSTLFFRIADCIVKSCDHDKKAAICTALDILLPPEASDSELKKLIANALTDAYGQQTSQKSGSASVTKLDTNSLLSQLEFSLEENNQLIVQCIAETGHRTDVAIIELFVMPQTSDFGLNESKNYLTSIAQALPEGKTMHVKLVADIDDKQHRAPLCRDICVFFSGLPDCVTVDLYPHDDSSHFNYAIFLCKDSICVLSYYDVLLHRYNSILTQDAQLLSQYWGSADTYLRGKTSLIHKASFEQLYAQKFFQSFSMMNERLCSIHTVMPMIFSDSALFELIASRHRLPPEVLEIHDLFEKTFQFWSAVIYKSAVIDFLFSGTLSVFGRIVILSREERREYLTQFLERSSQSNYEFAVLNDINPMLNRNDIDSTLFLSKRNLFFIRHSNQNQPSAVNYSNDVHLAENFHSFWLEINDLAPAYIMQGEVSAAFFQQGMKLI